MLRRGGLLAAVLTMVVAACGDAGGAAPTTTDLRELAFERSGGIAGITEQWILVEDGTLILPPTDVVEVLDRAGTAALFDRIDEAGFFDFEREYLPDDPCCDRFAYKLTVVADGRRHTVQTMDGTEGAPRELEDLLGEILAFVGG